MATQFPSRSHAIRVLFALLIAITLFSGCGQKQGASIYDTDKNPEHFPEAALSLIRDVEGNHYTTSNQITTAFMEMYDRHPDLLDNQAWRTVVSRVGVVFRQKADKLARQGLTHYQEASEYFALAASASLPDDDRTREGSRLFSVWNEAVNDGRFPRQVSDDWLKTLSLTKRIDLLKHFFFGDSVSRSFAKAYLADQLVDEVLLKEKADKEGGKTVVRADSAFLAYIGQVKASRLSAIASFENPDVDLIACQLLYHGDSLFSIETYLRPTKPVYQNFLVALNLAKQDTVSTPHIADPEYHLEFAPIPPPSEWEPGKIAIAICSLKVSAPIGRLSVSLVHKSDGQTTYIPVAGTGAHQVNCQPTVRIADQ